MSEKVTTPDSWIQALEHAAQDCRFETDSYFGESEIQQDIIRTYAEKNWPFLAAAERIEPYITRTELQEAPGLSATTGNRVLLKREDLQQGVRSFKIRGAANRMLQLSDEEKARGVITVSAGNHAQGVATMAHKLDIAATIIMPTTTPQVKIDAIRAHKAAIVLQGNNYSEALSHGTALLDKSGNTYIHAFGDPAVIEGQGTIGLEILADAPHASHVFVPIGGGGLAAGVGSAIKQLRPDVKIIGVQYEHSDAMAQSIELDDVVTLESVGGFSDGTAVAAVSPQTFTLVREHVDEIIRVSEDDIVLATSDFYTETRNYLEPAGALGLAGLQKYSRETGTQNQTMVAICSGGNIAPEKIAFTIERAALLRGQRALLSISIPERPGALRQLCRNVLNDHNITEFRYAYTHAQQAAILIGLSLTDSTAKSNLLQTLHEQQYIYQDHAVNALAQQHASHMVGGPSRLKPGQEATFHVSFPERPGALLRFLDTIGKNWNITRFDYCGSSSDTGNVLISFAIASKKDRQKLMERLTKTGYQTERITTGKLQQFIGKRALD